MASQSLYDRIYDLEEATWKALCKDGAALVPYLADDCIMMFPLGLKVTPKTQPSLHDILHSEAFVPWKTFEFKDVDVTPIGKDGAVISYAVLAKRPAPQSDDPDIEFDALCSTVWRWDNDKFVMAFHQQSLAS